MQKKTDNHNLSAKLAVRTSILREMNCDLDVADCFSGSETIWTSLAQDLPVERYLALDIKQKRGRLKLDSLRYLQSGNWTHNVIDLDAYGSPWEHYDEALKHFKGGAIFLTIGNTIMKNQSKFSISEAGLPSGIPIGMHAALAQTIEDRLLPLPLKYGFVFDKAVLHKNNGGNAHYFGCIISR
jgi:hypothetical protein